MNKRPLKVRRLGRIDYDAALDAQKQTEAAVIDREEADTLFLLEHPHTFTLGRSAQARGRFGERRGFKISGRFGL